MRRLAFLAIVLTAAVGTAAEPAPDVSAHKPKFITEYNLPGMDKKVSLDVIDAMDVVDLIKFLAVKGTLNVVVGKDVGGSSKIMLKDVALGEALEIVLAANGLAYEIRGNIIKVMSDKEYRDQYGEGFYERKQAKVIDLKYGTPSKIAIMLGEVKSSVGKIVHDDGTGTLVLIDTPEKIREMEDVIRQSELPTVSRVMPTVTTNIVLQYAKVEDVEAQITPLLSKEIGQVRSDKRTKTLIVTDLPNILVKVANLIASFDREQKQVFIEAKIVEVQLSDEFSMGVRWDHVFQGLNPRFALESSGLFPLLLDATSPRGQLSYHTIAAGGDLNAVVQALATVGDTKVLSNPHVAVLDGQEAVIKVITTQPYAELSFESGTTNVVGKTYKFVDVGVTLAVTPRINDNGFITVGIKPEVSSILGFYDDPTGQGKQGVPVVKKSTAETSVVVKDSVTIVIGGLIQEKKVKTISKIPLLGSIPLLGMLFRSEGTSLVNAETIVLMTPHIVDGTRGFAPAKHQKKALKGEAGFTGVDMP